jgi:hypothetical protein
VALLLASCIYTPPAVAPTGSLAPGGGKGGGPRTTNVFGVVFAGPRGEVTDRHNPAITVLFSRGMRSLDTAEDEGLPRLEVKAKGGAEVAGKLRWVGTRGLLFTPDKELPGASRFVVTVPAGTKALDGTPLANAYSFELSTPKPAVARTFPANGATSVRADAQLWVEFNQAVAPETLQKFGKLVVRHADGAPGEEIPFHASVAPHGSKPPPGWLTVARETLLVHPDKPLPLDAGLELTIAEGLVGAEGPMPTEKPFTLKARTYGPLRLSSFHCPRIASEGRCRAHNDLKITLSNPVAPEELKAHLKAPGLLAAPKAKAKAPAPKGPSSEHWLAADPDLGRKYKVTLTAGMKDVFGQKLAEDTSFEIETEPPFTGTKPPRPPKPGKPAVRHKAPVARAAAPVPDQPGPHRPELAYELQLGLAGSLVEATAATGIKSHKVPVGSVNIPTYQLSSGKLTEPQAMAWLGGTSLADFLERNHIPTALVTPGGAENTRAVRSVDLDALLGKTGRGAAVVAAQVPGESFKRALVRVTDLGITAKASRAGSLVWVTSLATGKPAAGAAVSLRSPTRGEVFSTRTDDQGLAEIPADRFDPFGDGKDPLKPAGRPAFLFVRSGDDWTWHPMDRSATDQRVASGFQDFNAQTQMVGMVYTDRGVYRPGETVKVAGVFRALDLAGMRAAAGDEVRVEAHDSSDAAVTLSRAKLDAYGSFSADLPVPKSAHLGTARIVATVHGRGHAPAEASQYVKFLAFKASEFKVSVTPDAKAYVRGDDASFAVEGEYLFGAPMAGANAHTSANRTVTSFSPPGADDFVTTDEARSADEKDQSARVADIAAADATLDPAGRLSRKVHLAMPGQIAPEQVVFEAEVEDVSRQTVAQHATVLVHPAEFYLGLKRPAERFVSAGGKVRAEVAAIEPSGARRAGANVKVELLSRKWVAAVEEQAGTSHRTSKLVDEVVGTCEVRTEVQPKGCDLAVPEAGYYVMRAAAQDPRGNKVRVSQSFYGVEKVPKAHAPIAWAETDTRTVKLETNKARYEIGDTARILLRSPFREADALVTVERNGVLLRKTVHVSGPMPVVEVPIGKEIYPNAFVAVHLVRGRISAPPEEGVDLGGPEFRIGYAELTVNPEAHRLTVKVEPAKKDYRPGEELDADVTVVDREGKPVESELTFYAVDEGVLMLTGYQTPDPLPSFVRRRGLSVYTVESREDLAHILPMRAGDRVPIRGFDYLASRGDKGDPGGGGGGKDGMRADFKTTAYFEAGKVTSREGKAHVHFKLPDNLTTFRLMAVAADQTDFFGSGEAKITTSKKLMARPALPRFVRVGDTFEASVVLSSKELPDAEVDVTLNALGVELKGDKSRRAKLTKGGSVEVRFPVLAKAPGEATFEFALRSGSEDDRVRVKRKVELPVSVEMTAAYGETKDGAAIGLGDLSSVRPDQGELRVRMAPTALVGLATSMEGLLDYPYGCTEQLVSRTLPLLSLGELARDLGVHMPAKVPQAIENAVDDILKNQRDDGGFGFWENSERSEPWLSGYVVLTLDAAKKAGHRVPPEALDSAVSFVRAVLGRTRLKEEEDPPATPPGENERPQQRGVLLPEEVAKIDYANAAFLADTLASIGAPDPGYLGRLFDARRGKTAGARGLLLHAMATARMSPDPLAILAKELEGELVADANSATVQGDDDEVSRAMLDSPARTTALVLRGLTAADPKSAILSRVARGLLGLRENGAWRSTQENGWALLALRDYRAAQEASTKSFEARAFLGSSLLASRVFKGTADAEIKLTVGTDRVISSGGPISFQALDGGQLFYAAELRYATTALPKEARDSGLFVKKLVRALRPEDVREATQWIPKQSASAATAGELVLIDLLLESSEARKQVVIDDPLPAGIEAVDTDLQTASTIHAVRDGGHDKKDEGKGPRPGELAGIGAAFRSARVHREIHDDRVLTFIEELPPGIYHFRYLGRATSIGRFVAPPTRVEAMYSPEVSGSTEAGVFEVRAKQ